MNHSNACIALALVLVLASLACGSSASTTPRVVPAGSTAGATSPAAAVVVAKVGDRVELDGVALTVTSAQLAEAGEDEAIALAIGLRERIEAAEAAGDLEARRWFVRAFNVTARYCADGDRRWLEISSRAGCGVVEVDWHRGNDIEDAGAE